MTVIPGIIDSPNEMPALTRLNLTNLDQTELARTDLVPKMRRESNPIPVK